MTFPVGQHGLIMADPPWLYSAYSEKGHEKGAHKHYKGMTFEELAAMRDQVLFSAAPDIISDQHQSRSSLVYQENQK